MRLLVRSLDKAVAVLERRGVHATDVELVEGDMLDAEVVARAVDGCDATIHAAAAIGVTGGGHISVLDQNTIGARTVIDAALAAGHDPVVHVSSVAVFVPPVLDVIRADAPLGRPRSHYGRSKLLTELELRARQDRGEPITIVYPGGVIGPDQPHLDATLEGIVGARTQGWPKTTGGVCLIDVRDLADALAATVTVGAAAPRRLVLGGRFFTWAELGALLDELTGVRAMRVPLPKPALVGLGSFLDLLRRVRPIAYPLTRDAADFMSTMVPTDDSATLAALGVTERPAEESLRDTVRWLSAAGHMSAKHAGLLAAPDS